MKTRAVRLYGAMDLRLESFELPEGMTLEQLERAVLMKTLQRYQGNRTLTAERLGLSRRTIQRKVKEHGLPF